MQYNVIWIEMTQNIIEKAIQAAIQGDWEEAVILNLNLLKEDNNNLATLNRLGRAYTELGDIEKARETFQKVIKFDKYNPIAKKNLKRLKAKQRTTISGNQKTSTLPIRANFIEEPGKTKTTQLVRLAEADVIVNLNIGQLVILEPKKRAVSVKTEEGTYIGSLPDDLSFNLKKRLLAGNKYEAIIRGIEGHSTQLLIRETHRCHRYKNDPSFLSTTTTTYNSDIRHNPLKQEPVDTRETGQEKD